MNQIRGFIISHATTSLLILRISGCLRDHAFLAKVTVPILKILTIKRQQFREEKILYMSVPFERVSENKSAFFRGMRVEVKVHYNVPLCMMEILKVGLSRKDGGVLIRTGGDIAPIQVNPVIIHAKMASIHSIRVKHRDDLKHKVGP